jgi:hypothetical protein
VERICEIPPAVRSAREVRRIRLRLEFKLKGLWTVGSAHSYPSTVRFDRSCIGFNLREQSGNPEKHRNIEASEFGKSGIPWTRDRQIHRGNPDELRAVHLLGQVAGTRSHRYIGGSEVKSSRPFESRNSEGIIAVDLR